MDVDDDSVDIRPWPVSELAGQLVACTTLARRGAIEAEDRQEPYERETDRFELEAWARSELVTWLTLADFAVLEADVATLTSFQLERCNDALIEASTIAWCLNIVPDNTLPIQSEGETERMAADWAPGPWTSVLSAIRNLRVRSDELLAVERERWELLYWRLGLPVPFDVDTLEALRETVTEVAKINLLPITDNDFAMDDGIAFSTMSQESLDRLAHDAEIRLRTLNWACGIGDRLDTAPLILDDE